MQIRKFILTLLYIAAYTLCIVGMTGCSNTQSENKVENSIVLDMEDKELENTLYTIIRDGSDKGSKYTVSEFSISYEDMYSSVEIKEKYISDNALYVKIDSNGTAYLYRFQLNTSGLIDSYIKYRVEA